MVERIRYTGWEYAYNVDKDEVKIHRGEPIEWPIFIVHDVPRNAKVKILYHYDDDDNHWDIMAYVGDEQLRVTILNEVR